MCSPTQGAMAGLQAGSSYMAQKGAADMQEFRNKAATKSAKAALKQDQKILLRKSQEEQEAYAQSNFDRKRRAMELEASANVAAGEAGVSGISVDRIMSNIGRQEGEIGVRAKKTYESTLASLADANAQAVSRMVARIQGLPPVTQPNLLATALTAFEPMLTDEAVESSDAAINGWWEGTFGSTNDGAAT